MRNSYAGGLRASELDLLAAARNLISNSASSKARINATELFSYFAFDVIAYFLLENGQSHFPVNLSKKGFEVIAILAPVPWLFHLAVTIPGVARHWLTFNKFAM